MFIVLLFVIYNWNLYVLFLFMFGNLCVKLNFIFGFEWNFNLLLNILFVIYIIEYFELFNVKNFIENDLVNEYVLFFKNFF